MATASEVSLTEVELDETVVPGAQLEEPLESHTVEALRMWLICHAVAVTLTLKEEGTTKCEVRLQVLFYYSSMYLAPPVVD